MSAMLRAFAVLGCAAVVGVAGVSVAAPAMAAGTPTVSSLSPVSGPVGTTLDILGSGLTGATGVTVGSSALVTPTSVTDSDVRVTVPSDATTGPVVVTTPSGSSSPTGPTFTLTTQQVATATETLSRTTTTYPQHVVVTGRLTAGAATVKGAQAHLQRDFAGSTHWAPVSGAQQLTTNAAGMVSWAVQPANTQRYRVVFDATTVATAATTAAQLVGVRPSITLALPSALPAPQRSVVKGRISPHLTGRLIVQRKVGSSPWATVGHATPTNGRFSTALSITTTGTYRFRVLRAADVQHLAGSTGTLRTTAVKRTLREGSTGADVRALQQRLRALHYDIGAVNGSYGTDTLHAVTAFEKVQRMTRDGVTTPAVWAKLAHPRVPKLRHPIPGVTAVEVDLKHQVLLIAKNGKIWRILDTSSAGGYLYTNSAGQTERAITPTGHFHFVYKLEGLVHSKLGTLFRPSYFNDTGYAIHGEGNGNDGGEVPPYPNSHGCVRITDNAVNRYYSLFAVGMSVWIY